MKLFVFIFPYLIKQFEVSFLLTPLPKWVESLLMLYSFCSWLYVLLAVLKLFWEFQFYLSSRNLGAKWSTNGLYFLSPPPNPPNSPHSHNVFVINKESNRHLGWWEWQQFMKHPLKNDRLIELISQLYFPLRPRSKVTILSNLWGHFQCHAITNMVFTDLLNLLWNSVPDAWLILEFVGLRIALLGDQMSYG